MIGPFVVDMDLDRPCVARDEDRVAYLLELAAEPVDIESRIARPEQEHRLVAETVVGVGHRRRHRGGRGRPGRSDGRRPRDEVLERTLQQPVETFPAGIDDAGVAQDRQE